VLALAVDDELEVVLENRSKPKEWQARIIRSVGRVDGHPFLQGEREGLGVSKIPAAGLIAMNPEISTTTIGCATAFSHVPQPP
jgi:hypothetical protein